MSNMIHGDQASLPPFKVIFPCTNKLQDVRPKNVLMTFQYKTLPPFIVSKKKNTQGSK